jgi:hypothetical protein
MLNKGRLSQLVIGQGVNGMNCRGNTTSSQIRIFEMSQLILSFKVEITTLTFIQMRESVISRLFATSC